MDQEHTCLQHCNDLVQIMYTNKVDVNFKANLGDLIINGLSLINVRICPAETPDPIWAQS